MNKKIRICQLMESYLNNVESSVIEGAYGIGARIKINNIFYSTTTKSIVVDCTVFLGEEINEDLFEIEPIELVIITTINLFYPNSKISILVSWDS